MCFFIRGHPGRVEKTAISSVPHTMRDPREFPSHLADLVEGVLSVSASVFEVVVSWKGPVDVPGDGAVLRGLLTHTHTKKYLHEIFFSFSFRNAKLSIPPAGLGRMLCEKK